MSSKRTVFCGGGGFIGGHLVADLLRDGQEKTYRWIHEEIKRTGYQPGGPVPKGVH